MDQITIINLLTNSGLKVFGMDSDFIYFQDPSCIFPAFDSILHYAWIVIMVLTAIMLFGWGMLYIKNGVKIDNLFNNAKTLILILSVLSLVKPIVDFVYCGSFFSNQCELFAKQCETKKVSITSVNELLDMRKQSFAKSDEVLLYENFDIIDSWGNEFFGIQESEKNFEQEPSPSQEMNDNLSSSNSSKFVSVSYQEKTTIYVHKDGYKVKRSGGSPAWRNNNPGNIRKSQFAYDAGAIGETDKWAVFPDETTGLNAVVKLLRSKKYNNLSLSAAISRYAPSKDSNNPVRYANTVSKKTGISTNTILNTLSDNDLQRIARAMRDVEGWIVGTEQRI
nr:hypothetical protein [Candidatus Enterousia merdequi]